jgi:glycosyltransferase involved in cell wall biosynthesis/peptidoglycan/xylan/chitin deacetylase (PgdA/CDA1 family)
MRLLIVDQHQFGYLTDTYSYARHLVEDTEITYIEWDFRFPRMRLDGVGEISVSREGNKIVRTLRYIRAVARLLRSGRFDVAFIVYFPGCSLLRLVHPSPPLVVDLRTGSEKDGRLQRWLENKMMFLESSLYRNVSIISDSLRALLGFRAGRCHLLPLGAEPRQYPPKTFDELRLLYVGTLSQRHIDKTVEGTDAFLRKHGGQIRLTYDIVGGGHAEDEERVRNAVTRSAYGDRFRIHGRIPYEHLEPFLERCNVGVGFIPQTPYYECQPATKIFEYILAGMPVLATGTAENRLILSEINGVVHEDSAQGFYEGLEQLHARQAAYNSDAIRASVADYHWRNIVRGNLRPFLCSLLHETRRQSRLTALRPVFKAVYRKLPRPLQAGAAAIDFAVASHPRVYRVPGNHQQNGLPKGALTISLDFELAWAWQYARRGDENYVAKGLREREQVPLLLKIFDEFNIPTTWATVGHLFLESCSCGADGLPHPGLPRPPFFTTPLWNYTSGDWYQHDPCSDARKAPAWYAPDLIEMILASSAGHELGCHGFSHVGFGSYCPHDVALAELLASRAAMQRFGLTPKSFVFPGDDGGNFPALVEADFKIVRAFPKPQGWISLPLRRKDGLWGLPTSSALDRGVGWSIPQRLARLSGLVRAAAENHMVAHIWLHPSLSRSDMDEVLVPFLRFCTQERDRGALDILTNENVVAVAESALNAAETMPA